MIRTIAQNMINRSGDHSPDNSLKLPNKNVILNCTTKLCITKHRPTVISTYSDLFHVSVRNFVDPTECFSMGMKSTRSGRRWEQWSPYPAPYSQ